MDRELALVVAAHFAHFIAQVAKLGGSLSPWAREELYLGGTPPRALWSTPWAWDQGQFLLGPVLAEESFSLRGKAHPVAMQSNQRTEQVSHEDSFREHLVQLCPLGMWAVVKMAAGHLCILKLLLCDPLPVCCFPSCLCGEESLQKSQQCIKTASYFMTNGVMLCASLCATLHSHNKDSIINKNKR